MNGRPVQNSSMADNEGSTARAEKSGDKFIAAITWSAHRVVVVHRRRHCGRSYVRLQTWNCHRSKALWYPTDRFYVIPIENASALAHAIEAAARDEPVDEKPRWLAAFEARKSSERGHGSIRRRRREVIIARQRAKKAAVVAEFSSSGTED